MLPPDDAPQDDMPGFEPEPGEAAIQAVLARIPTDFYKRLVPLLQLCAVANFLLLGRRHDPVPQAVTQLTGFDLRAAARVSRLRNSASLGILLLKEPETLYDFLLVGQLVFESRLFGEVRHLLAGPDAADTRTDEVAESLRAFVVELSEAVLGNLADYLTQTQDGQGPDLGLRHLQLESIFARLAHTLVPVELPFATEQANPAEDDVRSESPLHLRFSPAQLAALQLALRLPELLLGDPHEAFALAVTKLYQLRCTGTFVRRFRALGAQKEFQLDKDELCLLYQAAQLCALALLSGALDEAGFSAETLAARSRTQLPALCAELEQFVQWVQATFPAESALASARREVEALGELL